MKSIQIFTLIVGIMCVIVGALLFTAFLFPEIAVRLSISDGGMTSMLIMFFIISSLFAVSARQMNKE